MRTVVITLAIDERLMALVDAKAIENGTSKSKVARDILGKAFNFKDDKVSLKDAIRPLYLMKPREVLVLLTEAGYETTITTVRIYLHQIRQGK